MKSSRKSKLVDSSWTLLPVELRQEHFADYAPILPSLFSLNHQPTLSRPLYGSSSKSWDNAALERSIQGILAVLLSLRKKPLIRYERMSALAKKLGNEVQVCIKVVARKQYSHPFSAELRRKNHYLILEEAKSPRSY